MSFILFLSLNEVCPFAPVCFDRKCCALVRQLLVLNVIYVTFKVQLTMLQAKKNTFGSQLRTLDVTLSV